MADEARIQTLLSQYRASLETEPWDEQLTDDLLAALREESPETYADLEADASQKIERIMRNLENRG